MKARFRRWLLRRMDAVSMADHVELGNWTRSLERANLKQIRKNVELRSRLRVTRACHAATSDMFHEQREQKAAWRAFAFFLIEAASRKG